MTKPTPESAPNHKPESIRVFLDSVRWFCRPRNTDWRYVRYILPILPMFDQRLDIHLQRSWQVATRENARYAVRYALAKAGWRSDDGHSDRLDFRELTSSRCDVVFSHRGFPINAGPYPVVWQNTILDPAMNYGRGALIQREIDLKGPLFSRSAVVHVSTEAEVNRLGKTFPEIAQKFFCTPFFVPGAKVADRSILTKHFGAKEIKILFVGDQARRKGLDLLIEAFRKLSPNLKSRARLLIVSRLSDAKIIIPDDSQIEFHPGLPHEEVMKIMSNSHVFAMPSRFEGYGLVFLEAMSQGTVPIGPNWEVQRELLDEGKAGVLVDPSDVDEISRQLARLIEDDAYRGLLSANARDRFFHHYSPEVVSLRFYEMFKKALLHQA